MSALDFLQAGAVLPAVKATAKKQLLQELSQAAAPLTGLDERAIFDSLLQRERLGSTGIGNGVAIPHGKLSGVKTLFGLFARLDKPIEFEALDGDPVDLVFVLLAPEGAGADHLRALARVARIFRDPETVQKLRVTRDAAALHTLLTEGKPSQAA